MSTTTTPTTPQKQENPASSPVGPGTSVSSSSPSGEPKAFPYHSTTSAAIVRKVEQPVYIQGINGEIEVLTKDQFESKFVKVQEDKNFKELMSGKIVEGHKTEKGFLIHGPRGVEYFDSQEEVEKFYKVL